MSNPSREQMMEPARQAALDMGWERVEFEDLGGDVSVMLYAQNDQVQQMAIARLSALVRTVQDVGCAADYSPAVTYDIDEIGYAGHEDPDGTPEAAADTAVQAAVEAGDPDPFREDGLNAPADMLPEYVEEEAFPAEHYGPETDPFTADAAASIAEAADRVDEPTELEKDLFASVPAVELAQAPLEVKPVKTSRKSDLVARCKALGITGYSGLRIVALKALIRNAERMQGAIEDVSGDGIEPATIMSPKEIAQAALVDDQDRGGLPQSQQILQAAGTKKSAAQLFAELDSVIEFEGRTIVARHGAGDVRVMGSRVEAGVKARWEAEGWTFTHVSKEHGRTLLRALTDAKRAAAGIGTAAVSVTHKRGEALVERHPNGRTYAKKGYVFRVFKGDKSFEVATVNEALWRSKGWNLAVKAI